MSDPTRNWNDKLSGLADRPLHMPPAGPKDPLRPWCYRRPDGTAVTCVGNNSALLLVAGEVVPADPDLYDGRPPGLAARGRLIDDLMRQPHDPVGGSTAADLRAAAGEPATPTEGDDGCPECDGTGRYRCSECEHDRECRECDGTGKVDPVAEYPDPTYVRVGRLVFDARYLAPLFALIPDGPVRVSVAKKDVLRVVGDKWLILMSATQVDAQALSGSVLTDLVVQPHEPKAVPA